MAINLSTLNPQPSTNFQAPQRLDRRDEHDAHDTGTNNRPAPPVAALGRPYCTVGEAAAWLRVSPETVARMLVPIERARGPGELRYRRIEGRKFIRVVAEDVLAVLPPVEE